MPHQQKGHIAVDELDGWWVLGAEAEEIAGGLADILVHIQYSPEHIRSVAPTLSAVESEIGTLTLARTVEYEWLGDDADNDVVASASSALLMARDLVPIRSPALVVFPGTVDATVRRFAARSRRTLVLVAIDESTAVPGRW